jgi:preprotein translocase subunit SecE
MTDKIKLTIAALFVGAAIGGYYYLGASPMIARIGVILAGVLVATAVAWTSEPGKRFHVYSQEAVAETRKVVWPTRKETLQTTGVVVAFVIVMALFLWIVDAILAWAVELFVH